MCGRYYVDQEDDLSEMRKILTELNKKFQGQQVLSEMRTGEIFPTHVAPVLQASDFMPATSASDAQEKRQPESAGAGTAAGTGDGKPGEMSSARQDQEDQGRKISPGLMRWGFERPYGSGVVINARAETAAEKPFFRQAFKQGRVLIPASSFFEWRKLDSSKQKVKLSLPDESTFYMAGLSQPADDITGARFVILTTAAQPAVAAIHDRQPLILPRSWLRSWVLDETLARQLLSYVLEKQLQLQDV